MTVQIAILVALAVIAIALWYIARVLHNIDRKVAEWRMTWGQIPVGASDYHAKEIMKATQEVAHYLAMAHLEKRDRDKQGD